MTDTVVAHTITPEEVTCLGGCSTYKQYHHMRTNFEQENCVFCNIDRKINIILHEDENFMLWEVPEGMGKKRPLNHHIMIVPKRHIRFVGDLTNAEAISMVAMNRYALDSLEYVGGMNHAREGDMRLNAGTVPHLHFNLFEPDLTAEVRIPVAKAPEDRQANQGRAAAFALRYEAGELPA